MRDEQSLLRCNLVIPQCMCQVSLRLKEVQMGTHDFEYNKVPIFASLYSGEATNPQGASTIR